MTSWVLPIGVAGRKISSALTSSTSATTSTPTPSSTTTTTTTTSGDSGTAEYDYYYYDYDDGAEQQVIPSVILSWKAPL